MNRLVALHNITEEKLKDVMELGAIPMPSIAITRDDFPFQSFGEITFVFKKSAVDPRVSKCNDIFEADAYTCRVPQILYEYDEENLGNVLEDIYGVPTSGKKFYGLNSSVGYNLEESVDVVYHAVKEYGIDLSKDEILRFLKNNYKYKGIRKKNVDAFTASGTRRRIKGLTIPYTLENIMKAMKKASDDKIFLTMHAWKGLLAKRFTCLSAIPNEFVEEKKAEDMYNKVENEYIALCSKCFPIINKGYGGYFPMDINDYLYKVKYPTPTAYKSMFAKYNIEITDELAEEITALANKVIALPVSYMEAKPRRIVNFNEAFAVIVPNTLSIKKDVKKLAEENGLKFYEYGEEKERQEIVRTCAKDPAVVIKTF